MAEPEEGDEVALRLRRMGEFVYGRVSEITNDPGDTVTILLIAAAIVGCRDVKAEISKQVVVNDLVLELTSYIDQLWDMPNMMQGRFRDVQGNS